MLLTVVAGVLFFLFGLPWLADRVARAIPPEVEAPIGEQVMAMLDATALEPSALDAAQQARWQAVFDRFMANQPQGSRYRLAFRDMGAGVANAFAVPGGSIVFTDALLEGAQHEEEFIAVLAHELGHQVERHVMRAVLQQSAVALLVAVFTGDVSAATGVAVAVPTFLLDNHYSREFEREADAFAFRALRERGLPPEWFAVALGRIARQSADAAASDAADADDDVDDDTDDDDDGNDAFDAEPTFDYASSHPATTERLAAARAAGADLPSIIQTLVARPETSDHPALWPPLVPVARADLVGCWRGVHEDDKWPYGWFIERTADGHFERLASGVEDTPSADWSDRESGDWTVGNGRYATHTRSVVAGAGEPSATDAIDVYRIESFEQDTMQYRQLGQTEVLFGAERVDCAQRPAGGT
jgi:Zn-dependent protease with chaperone function